MYKELLANPDFEMYASEWDYNKVFKLKNWSPPYAHSDPKAQIRVERWIPDRRRFEVESIHPGKFRLSEQFYPGWQAQLDRKPAPLLRCETAFQCVDVPAGKHLVEFVYRPASVVQGLAISLTALLGLAIYAFQPQLYRLDPRPAAAWAIAQWQAGSATSVEFANSRQLARLLGPTLTALAVSQLWTPRLWDAVPATAVYQSGALLFAAGLAIVLIHNLWTRGWAVAITLVGWLAMLGGLSRMFSPAVAKQTGTTELAMLMVGLVLVAKGIARR